MEAPPVCEPRSNVSGEVLEYWREQLERARRRVYTQKLALGWLSLTQGGYRVLLTDAEPLVAAKTCWPLSESLESIDPREEEEIFATLCSNLQAHSTDKEMAADDGDNLFGDIGRQPGVYKWRVESLKPVVQPFSGQLHTGDAYIFLDVHEVRFGGSGLDIHFWLGAEASQDEVGGAAILSAQLDSLLGGTPTIYRQVQGEESDEFLQMFSDSGGVRYLKGGVTGGFSKVSQDKPHATLFRVSGNRAIRITEVELTTDSLNSSDCFLLDLGDQLYQWNGKAARPKTRICTLDLAIQQRDDVHGGGLEISTVEEDDRSSPAAAAFFAALGCENAASVSIQGAGPEGTIEEAPQELTLYKVDSFDSPSFKEVCKAPMTAAHLEAKHCFVLNTGKVVYVWLGSSLDPSARARSTEIGTHFVSAHGEKSAQVKVVKSGLEPPIFKQHFPDWTKVMSTAVPAPPVAQPSVPQQDLEALITGSGHGQDKDQVAAEAEAASAGKLTIWLVRNFELMEWPESRYGEFFAADSFVVLNSYELSGSSKHIIYFWQGCNSTIEEKGASALLTTKVDMDLSGMAIQVRVEQNKEPQHFLQLFKGSMLVFSGDAPDNPSDIRDAKGVTVFHCKGASKSEARAVQVGTSPIVLNWSDAYVVLAPSAGVVYCWLGDGASPEEIECCSSIAETAIIKQAGAKKVVVKQGEEPQAFWESFGGKTNVKTVHKAKGQGQAEPRLFLLSDAKTGGKGLWFEEIHNFSQNDLMSDDVMLLDTGNEVFLWVGPRASENESSRAESAAQEYLKASSAAYGRQREISVKQVRPGNEPPEFTCHFVAWHSTPPAAFEDPYQARLVHLKEEEREKGINPAYRVTLSPVTTPNSAHTEKEAREDKEGLLALQRDKLRRVKLQAQEESQETAFASPQETPVKHAQEESTVRIPPDGTKLFSADDLREMKAEDGIDCTVKELYLSGDDFKAVFGMDPSSFKSLPVWRQRDAKKKAGLF